MVLHNSRNETGLQYEPKNLDVNKVCCATELDVPERRMNNKDLKPWSTLIYRV